MAAAQLHAWSMPAIEPATIKQLSGHSLHALQVRWTVVRALHPLGSLVTCHHCLASPHTCRMHQTTTVENSEQQHKESGIQQP